MTAEEIFAKAVDELWTHSDTHPGRDAASFPAWRERNRTLAQIADDAWAVFRESRAIQWIG